MESSSISSAWRGAPESTVLTGGIAGTEALVHRDHCFVLMTDVGRGWPWQGERQCRGPGAGKGFGAAMSWCLFGRLDVESLKRELQVLSEQYSQKCLEIGELTQKAEEREQILERCQQEGKDLLRKNQAREGLSCQQRLWSTGACSSLTQHSPSVKTPLFVHISSLLRFYHQKAND